MTTSGKRAGSRKGAKAKPSFSAGAMGLCAAITGCVIAWGYLVYAAIDFGTTAREGDSNAWWFLALAAVGAMACLFFGLMLVVSLLRRIGVVSTPEPPAPAVATAAAPDQTFDGPRPAGGKRAAR